MSRKHPITTPPAGHPQAQPTSAELIDAAAYYRMSDDEQEGSIEQQRAEVAAYALAHGYRIVAEYIDENRSASKDRHKRVSLDRLLLDSHDRRWKVLLCWKLNRFTREHSKSETDSRDKNILIRNGVRLVTAQEGLIDWTTMPGRILDCVLGELNHKYSQDVSADSLRGRLARLEEGWWPSGSIPYGYDRRYVKPSGEAEVVLRTTIYRIQPSWRLTLQINEVEAEIVRWIFEQFVSRGRPRRSIAAELTRRGVPSPRAACSGTGREWSSAVVRRILTNTAYLGICSLGQPGRNARRGEFNHADNRQKAGSCKAILEDKGVWEQAQALLAGKGSFRPRGDSGA